MQQTALITGASQGIGAAIAKELSQHDIHTILLSRNIDKLNTIAAEIQEAGGSCSCYPCDITQPAEIESALDHMEKDRGQLPLILVNNAGLGGPFHQAHEVSEAEWDLVFNTNVKAAFLFCRRFLPVMRQQQFGRIINISSIYGITGGARSSTYAASKHALTGYTKSLAVECGNDNITCNIISPGYIDTNREGNALPDNAYLSHVLTHIPGNKLGSPEDIAQLVYFLSQPISRFINGADIVIDGGMLAGYKF